MGELWSHIKDKVITGLVAAVAGAGVWLWDANTMDHEVKPNIAALEQSQQQLAAGLQAIAKSAARSEVNVAIKDIAELERKARTEWTDEDRDVYRAAKSRILGAREDLESLSTQP